jgi:glycosyltransferase involved in cell wall biosynthesis
MDLSVVIPCLNAAGTIGAQLEALSRQRWAKSWEVIIADNGSTDGSQSLVASYQDRLPRLRVVDASDRRGAAHARNIGARAARGNAILFCDADDEAAAGWLAAMGNALGGCEAVVNRFDFVKLNVPAVARDLAHVQSAGLQKVAYPPFLLHAGGSGLGVQRVIHEALGGFDESLAVLEDTDYCFRLQLRGHALSFVPEAIMHVRYDTKSGALFRQARQWARFNVLLYKRYGQGTKLARPWRRHLSTWRALVRNAPRALDPESRTAWIRTLGTQLGVLHGTILHRVPPIR